MNRKQFIVSGIAATLLSSLPVYAMETASKKKSEIFILIPGAWHGAFIYKRLAALLWSDGHFVYTPTLSGLAEHSHQFNPDINLTTHIQDISSLIEYEDISNVIIVAHSYAGMVLAGVSDKLPERISHAIYLDAFLPENGKSL